jgi:uncharacterized membrane protein
MKSTAQIAEHPIHPMVIPFPFALLSTAFVFDLGARLTGKSSWSQTASHLSTAGLGTALAAALPGIIDYFGSVPSGTRAKRTATTHALTNVSALACFAMARAQRRPGRCLPSGAVALELLGTGLLSFGGWLGGQLVYHEHIGVVEDGAWSEAEPRLPFEATADDTEPMLTAGVAETAGDTLETPPLTRSASMDAGPIER